MRINGENRELELDLAILATARYYTAVVHDMLFIVWKLKITKRLDVRYVYSRMIGLCRRCSHIGGSRGYQINSLYTGWYN